MDPKFAKLNFSFEPVEINTTAAHKYMNKIEQSICVIKKQVNFDCPTFFCLTKADHHAPYLLCTYISQCHAS